MIAPKLIDCPPGWARAKITVHATCDGGETWHREQHAPNEPFRYVLIKPKSGNWAAETVSAAWPSAWQCRVGNAEMGLMEFLCQEEHNLVEIAWREKRTHYTKNTGLF